MKKVARVLCKHQELVLNWFRAKGAVSGGMEEGFNLKAKLTMRKAYGFRNVETLQIALYHTLGKLSEPKITHRFCAALRGMAANRKLALCLIGLFS